MTDYFTNKRFLAWVIIILVVLNIGTLTTIILMRPAVPAWHKDIFKCRKDGKPSQECRMADFFARELKLTDEQKKRFGEMRHKHYKKIHSLKNEIHQRQKALFREHLFRKEIDTTEVELLIHEIAVLHKQMEQENFMHFRMMHEVLSPEQRIKFREIFGEILQRMHRHKQQHYKRIKKYRYK